MMFIDRIDDLLAFDVDGYLERVTENQVQASLNKVRLNRMDFLNLISPAAEPFIEAMAVRSRNETVRNFGRTVGLYAPIYISDYCANGCIYCGFNAANPFERTRLSLEEIEEECRILADTGIRHTMLLTGEDHLKTPLSYLEAAVQVMKRYFASISLEIFPMDREEYQVLNRAGADALTVYQEVYDRTIYREVHPWGKKADFVYRLGTPERAAQAGFRSVNIGTLFGLGDLCREVFVMACHARFLEKKYPHVEIGLSMPRMQKADNAISPRNLLSDFQFVQFMTALRIYLPSMGMSISTRESAPFRDRLLHLGVTRLSAGSKTDVGGYARGDGKDVAQFDIADDRSVDEVVTMIANSGYQPVFKDWESI
ncbi:MAG: 2-iminoacetate synthase ThiH [Desulfobacteraceae bacterium]